MRNLKNENGITLVALVVTIIVLLILAGVSLSLVAGGNGIINKSVKAVDQTNVASAKEQAELKLAELVADYYEEKYVTNSLAADITNQLGYIASKAGSGISAGEYTVTVTTDGALTVKKGTVEVAKGTVSTEGKATWTTTTPAGTPSASTSTT